MLFSLEARVLHNLLFPVSFIFILSVVSIAAPYTIKWMKVLDQ